MAGPRGTAAPATLVIIVTELVVQAPEPQLVFALSTDIPLISVASQRSNAFQNTSILRSNPFLLHFMHKMYPKYGKPVHPHQVGSSESHFWLSLLWLLHILQVYWHNHMVKAHPDEIIFLDLMESSAAATMLVKKSRKSWPTYTALLAKYDFHAIILTVVVCSFLFSLVKYKFSVQSAWYCVLWFSFCLI